MQALTPALKSMNLSVELPDAQRALTPSPLPGGPLSPSSIHMLALVAKTTTVAPSLTRANSTNTLYIKTSMQHPDRAALIFAVADRIYHLVEAGNLQAQADWDACVAKVPHVFDEYRYRPPPAGKRVC